VERKGGKGLKSSRHVERERALSLPSLSFPAVLPSLLPFLLHHPFQNRRERGGREEMRLTPRLYRFLLFR